MAWRDKLSWDLSNTNKLKASFRGATFVFENSDTSIGRRNVVHQYPYKDSPYIEDLGKDTDEFTVTGYVIQNNDNGQDYFIERDALIKALKESGPGTLIHPFLGEKIVNLVGKARISESFREGGIARFSMTFVMVDERQMFFQGDDFSTTDYIESVDIVAVKSSAQANDGFADRGDFEIGPGYAENSFIDAIDSLNNMLRSVTKSIQGAFPSQVSKALTILAQARAGIDVSSFTDACELATGIVGMFNGLKSIAGMYGELLSDQLLGACSDIIYGYYTGPMSGAKVISSILGTGFAASTMSTLSKINEGLGKTVVRAMLNVNRFGEEGGGSNPSSYGGTIAPIVITTYQRAKQSANLIAIINLSRINAMILAVQTAVRIDYTSYDSSVEMAEEVTAELDALLLKLGNDAADTDYDSYNITIDSPLSYQAVESLRPVFINAMEGIRTPLAKIVNYKIPPITLSSLVLAYEKYQDLDRENEIIMRNIPLISHPGFLPGGKEVEILNV